MSSNKLSKWYGQFENMRLLGAGAFDTAYQHPRYENRAIILTKASEKVALHREYNWLYRCDVTYVGVKQVRYYRIEIPKLQRVSYDTLARNSQWLKEEKILDELWSESYDAVEDTGWSWERPEYVQLANAFRIRVLEVAKELPTHKQAIAVLRKSKHAMFLDNRADNYLRTDDGTIIPVDAFNYGHRYIRS